MAHSNLVSCHCEVLRLARQQGFASIAFPALGTGVRGYPLEEAASAALTPSSTSFESTGLPVWFASSCSARPCSRPISRRPTLASARSAAPASPTGLAGPRSAADGATRRASRVLA